MPHESQAPTRGPVALSWTVIAVALLVLAGWAFDVGVLKSVLPHYITMKANTALGLGLLAGALLCFRRARPSPSAASPAPTLLWRTLGRAAAVVTICIGVATLIEYSTGANLGIDELLFADPGAAGRFPPGRLAPITAINFVVIAVGLLLSNRRVPAPPSDRAAHVLFLIGFTVGFQALVGYLSGVSYSFGSAFYTQMAVHTAVLFVLLCGAILWDQLDRGLMAVLVGPGSGGRMARRLLLAAVLGPPLIHRAQLLAQSSGLFDQDFGVLAQVMGNVIFFAVIIWRNAFLLHESDLRREESERKLRELASQDAARSAREESAGRIRASEERLRAIFDSTSSAVVGTDAQGRITDWNARASEMFGWSRDEVLGKKAPALLFPSAHRPVLEAAVARSLETDAASPAWDGEGLRRSGEVFAIQISLSPIRVGQDTLFMAFIHDITERKRNEVELIAARQAALEAARAKAEFLANMSHEIRTPLNGIIGMTDLILDTPLDAQQRKYARIVQESGAGLLTIVNDILDFSKIEAGKMTLEVVDFSVVQLLEGQADLFVGRAAQKGLSLHTFVDPRVAALVRGDPGRIAQVLINLVGNAVKFTAQGRVVLSAAPDPQDPAGSRILFSVQDTGVGIDKATLTRLFQPFTQADGSTARKYGGTGLGLSISKRLVELMGGRMDVETALGTGSTFWFSLPLPAAAASSSPALFARDASGAARQVLILSDDACAASILRQSFEAWGLAARSEVGAASELFARVAAAPFEASIIDVRPFAAALELARGVQQLAEARGRPLILVRSFGHEDKVAPVDLGGLAALLSRPLKQGDLREAMALALRESTGEGRGAQAPEERAAESALAETARRILVAEDNAVNQMLALALLRKMGLSAQAVTNGREAVELLESGAHFDLVLMDCQMPEMDGFEATRAIRAAEGATGRHIPIIALTANALREDEQRCVSAGMDDYVSKPVKREQLERAVRKWLSPDPGRGGRAARTLSS